MRKNTPLFATSLLALALTACSNGNPDATPPHDATPPTPTASAPAHESTASTATTKGVAMDDLNTFATDGYRLMDSVTGDLSDDGQTGALLVLDPPASGNEKLGEGTPRRVLILTRDEGGKLHVAASNDKVVPCSTCGGVAGDPYGFSRVEPGQFTISNGGGSRERWSDDFTFTYSPAHKDWQLSKAARSVSDEATGTHKAIELTPKDFGDITFKDFDPAKLPKVELP